MGFVSDLSLDVQTVMSFYGRKLALRLRKKSAGVADSGERPENLLFVAAASQPVMHPCSNYACLLLEMHASSPHRATRHFSIL
jgi:hypothetical protein